MRGEKGGGGHFLFKDGAGWGKFLTRGGRVVDTMAGRVLWGGGGGSKYFFGRGIVFCLPFRHTFA